MKSIRASKTSRVYVALLRGINVGGKNKLTMKDLVEMFVAAGCSDVQTYIQSGNVIFRADGELVGGLAKVITQKIEGRFGYRIPVVLREMDEIAAVMLNNPFLKAGLEDSLHVCFLADRPSVTDIEQLDPKRSVPDVFAVVGQEIYMRLPNGAAKTKLTNAYFDSKLRTVSTVRNWRTVGKLLELMS
jgi:uncharacterized protein (DUF1697 family)